MAVQYKMSYIYIFLSLLTISDLIVGENCLLNMYSCSSLAAFFIAYALTFNHKYHWCKQSIVNFVSQYGPKQHYCVQAFEEVDES